MLIFCIANKSYLGAIKTLRRDKIIPLNNNALCFCTLRKQVLIGVNMKLICFLRRHINFLFSLSQWKYQDIKCLLYLVVAITF